MQVRPKFMTNEQKKLQREAKRQRDLEENGVPRKLYGGDYRLVDPQILRWRRARRKAKRNAAGGAEAPKSAGNAKRDSAKITKMKNIFVFDDNE